MSDGKNDVVDVPAVLREVPFTIPMRLIEARYHDEPGELALEYEFGLETLPAFTEKPTKVRFEVRFQIPRARIADVGWVNDARENVEHFVTRDVQEALGLLCGVARGALEVTPRLDADQADRFVELAAAPALLTEQFRVVPMDASEAARGMIDEGNRAIAPVLWPLRIAAALVWLRARPLFFWILLVPVLAVAWILAR